MKHFVWFAMLILAAAAWAQTPASSKPASRKAAGGASISAQDAQALKDALAAQQRQMEAQRNQIDQLQSQVQQLIDANRQSQALQQQLQLAATDAQQKAAAAQAAASDSAAQLDRELADVKTTFANSATSAQDEQKRVSALEGLVGRFRFNGDIRVRGESYFQDFPAFQNRNRARVRVRFGFEGKLNEDFTSGVAIATGSLGDPTTTNETLTNFFDRKTIGLDRAYITYNPVAHNWFSATGGKFAYQWQRTAVTGDPDLNPEGFDIKASFNLRNPVVKNFTAQAISYLFNEVTSGTDSYAVGGQVSTRLQYGRWTATPSFLALRWNNSSAMLQASAFAVQATTSGFTYPTSTGGPTGTQKVPVPGEGPGCAAGTVGGGSGSAGSLPVFPPCAFSPNGMTNAVVIGPDGKTPQFLSGFFYGDFILNNQFKTGAERFPVNLVLEFEKNLAAADHPLDSKGNVLSNLGPQDKEYGVDVSIGQTRNRNDVQFGYAWYRQEQDSVLASFAESDQRAPTNLLQNRIYALWKLRANTLASFTWWHGRTLNSNLENNAALAAKSISKAGQTEPYLNRLQFDLIYTF